MKAQAKMLAATSSKYIIRQIGILLYLGTLFTKQVAPAVDTDIVGLTTAQILNLRGFNATDYYYTSSQGYIINVVWASNPKTPADRRGRLEPVLFIHGFATSSKSFVANSLGAAPRDLSDYNAADMTLEQLEELVGDDPSFNNLPMACLIMGYEVVLMNRRGTKQSLGQVDPTKQPFDFLGLGLTPNLNKVTNPIFGAVGDLRTGLLSDLGLTGGSNPPLFGAVDILTNGPLFFNYSDPLWNPRYWNYSIDQQIESDVPVLIDLIIAKSGHERVSIVGWSLGGAITLTALTVNPNMANKVKRIILWAPAANLKGTREASALTSLLLPTQPLFINLYNGPLPPALLNADVQQDAALFCALPGTNSLLCETVADLILGGGGDQQEITPGEASVLLDLFSSHETATLLDSIKTGQLHYFDWLNPIQNQLAYGTPTAPIFDFSRIKCRTMTFFGGNTDILVTPTGLRSTISKLSVPYNATIIGGPGIFFNHGSYALHKDVRRLAILPTLMALQTRGQCT